MTTTGGMLSTTDRAILRELATQVREAAESERNQARLRRWRAHDEMAGGPPLLLTETDGGLRMVLPDFAPRCTDPWAQGQEWGLASILLHFETIDDDFPIEPYVSYGYPITISNFGVEVRYTRPDNDGKLGAYHIEPPLQDLARDFDQLRPRTYTVDRARAMEEKARLEEVYDGILGVRPRGNPWWTMGLTWTAILLIGLENLMLYMYDEPEALHQLMAFLRDENLALLDWMTRENLFNLNNENDYIGSGSRGYTSRLPQPDWQPGHTVRTRDLWTLIESQETVGVGPDLYAEFIFPYENTLAQRFGGVYYGCCEPVNTRWTVLKQMANLKRISVSPWCNEAFMAEALGTQYVYSRKPNPTLVSTERFNEDAIRADLRTTMQLTKAHGNTVEIVMKDVHTLNGESDRLTRWVRIAREVSAEVYG